jgi:class 3 adenylate cyclase
MRNLLLSFQKVCAELVQRHEGQIGLFIGDGVTAYFGYPRAHEDSDRVQSRRASTLWPD